MAIRYYFAVKILSKSYLHYRKYYFCNRKYSFMEKIQLEVYGVSHSQTHSGAYALILKEKNGNRRLPIIIGTNEAQAIAIKLEDLQPQRPLTHDLFLTLANSFDIQITEVHIVKIENVIFYSELVCSKDNTTIRIDSRTSDAIALAVRFGCPIYTNEKVLQEAGVDFNTFKQVMDEPSPSEMYSRLSDEQLKEQLEKAIKDEKYEEASKIRDELIKRGYKF